LAILNSPRARRPPIIIGVTRSLKLPPGTARSSPNLFYPSGRTLLPCRPEAATSRCRAAAAVVSEAIHGLLSRKNYPCVAALSSLRHAQYRVGIYADFGAGASSRALGRDLALFKAEQTATRSPYLSFWAVFDDAATLTEEGFEGAMWRELSSLSASTPEASRWDPKFSADPKHRNFCFSFEGDAFFLVGMHPRSSRLSRRFPLPTVVFNLYEQFEALGAGYEPMVKLNRSLDCQFQGNVNPVVERWADKWESIQFSGRDNPADWKCPFRPS